jgi:acyl-CoA thioesterase-1
MFSRRWLIAAQIAFLAATAHAAEARPPVVTILGDSITAGLGLAAADALPAQLQGALARLGVKAVVRGAGVSGDTTSGGLARLDFSVQADTTVCAPSSIRLYVGR